MSEEMEMRDIFFEETNEMVEQLEQDILSLENNSEDKDIINRIFRAAHTIKGSASFVGFMGLSTFSHKMENVLDLVRKDQIQVDGILTNTLLKGLDTIKKILLDPENDELIKNDADILAVISEFNRYLPEVGELKEKKVEKPKKEEYFYRIKLNFNRDIFETGTDPLMLIDELFSKGEVLEYNVSVTDLPDVYNLDPYTLYISWNIFLKVKSEVSKKDIDDIFIFVIDDNDITIEEVEEVAAVEDKKIGEILVGRGLVKESDVEEALEKQTKVGEILIKEGKVTSTQVQKVVQQQQDARKNKEVASIRVDTQKLDKLMNLVGELVINQARVTQIASKKEKIQVQDLIATAETLDRITRDIQEQIMRARMVPIENTFNQFQRMVRDLAMERGKDIKLNILGKETELDKTIIELINDPLKHMTRNSIDHGVETKEERLAVGKSETAVVTLNAYHEAGNIVIEVGDDGRGLNREKILSKAREKGLVPPDKELSDDEIYHLIFMAGFSTADQLSEISGRGVGMDVVKNNISRLRGSIEIQTKEGQGTIFRIILPLTLAIIDGMLVKVGEELYIIPLLSIVESIRPKASEVKHVNVDSEVVNVRGEYLPLVRLYQLLNTETEYKDPSKALIVIVNSGKNKACLLVDDIIGQQQAVIKSLEENFSAVSGISGATILGDGNLAMIVDVSTIIKMAAS